MVKEDVVVTTITVHSMEQNVVVLSILWAGYVLLFGVVAWRVYKSLRDVARDESSSGDTSRALFYKLLGMALLSRIIFIPIQNVWDGEMIQLVAETLPQLMFASAWALLVSFFSNLVATASGGVSSNKPSLLIDIAVYLMYIVLVVWYWWNDAAAVLLYALLCIVFAGLFGSLAFFGPKLLALLQPSLERQSGLSIRLITCCTVGVLVFLLQAISLALTVVSTTAVIHFWVTEGCFELLPSSMLLIMMHPTTNKQDTPPVPSSNMKRVSSGGSVSVGGGGNHRVRNSTGEMAALLKPHPQYGSGTSKEGP
jgi:hypothetical protein